MPQDLYRLLKSYLTGTFFRVNYQYEYSLLHSIRAGVPQGNLLGPVLYQSSTADLPMTAHTIVTTYAVDTAILSFHTVPAMVLTHL